MKRLFRLLSVAVILASVGHGQDLSMPPDGGSPSLGGSPRDPAAYSSDAYGHRAEVFVNGFGSTSSENVGNSVVHDATNTGGFSAGYRFHLNRSSALEGRYAYSRNSQKYDVAGAVSAIETCGAEVTGSYVYSFSAILRIQPFVEDGGGIIHFSPANYGAQAYSTAYAPAAGAYAGSTPGVSSQTGPAFAYGAGFDVPIHSRISIRAEYRGLGYKTPDFGLPALRTGVFGLLSEPSVGFSYRF